MPASKYKSLLSRYPAYAVLPPIAHAASRPFPVSGELTRHDPPSNSTIPPKRTTLNGGRICLAGTSKKHSRQLKKMIQQRKQILRDAKHLSKHNKRFYCLL